MICFRREIIRLSCTSSSTINSLDIVLRSRQQLSSLGQDDDTIAQMDGAGTPESLTPVNSKEPSPEVIADTSDQIQDKETEILMIVEKNLQQEN